MPSQRDLRFAALVREFEVDLGQPLHAVNNYQLAVLHDGILHVSGQLPRNAQGVAVTGSAGDTVSFEAAQHAARLCAVRALTVMHQTVGTLDAIERLLSMTVYVHSAPDFTRQSEVADAASALLHDLLGTAGQHARSAVGVLQLPKNATVEIDLRAAIRRSN